MSHARLTASVLEKRTRLKAFKAGLLSSTALSVIAMGGGQAQAQANTYSIGGGPAVTFPSNAFDPLFGFPQFAPLVVNVGAAQNSSITAWTQTAVPGAAPITLNISSSGSVNSAGYGVQMYSWGQNNTLTNNGSITAVGTAVDVRPNFFVGGGSAVVNGTGTITSTAGYGIGAVTSTANFTADGMGAGTITAAIDGVYANSASATTGQGTITVQNYTGGITGGNNGVTANFGTGTTLGDVLVTNNGPITGTARNGVETYTFGNTTITDNGNITGAINGIAANFNWASPGNVTISGNQNVTGGATGSGIVAGTGTGNIDISAPAITTGGTGIWAVSSLGGNVLVNGAGTGTATGTTVDGVRVNTSSATAGQGLATVQNFTGGITGANNGVTVNFGTGTTLGDVLVTNNGPITGTARNGVETYTFGDTTITNNGDITGAINGIAANFAWASPGDVTISGNQNITGGGAGSGIVAGTGTGNINISAGAMTTGGTGIYALSSLGGNVTVDGAGTGVVTGTVLDGVIAQTLGNATVNNFATIDGVRNGIYVFGTGAGTSTSIQGNGLTGGITGTTANGIVVGPSAGDVNIGTVATNGVITGGVHGIWTNNTAGAGAVNITVDRNVTGTTGDGIFSGTLSGNQTINILSPAIVQGGLYGLATGTTTGTATTNNAGIIQNIGDAVGAAGNPGLQAVWLGTGNNTVNNNAGGQIIGGFTTGGLTNTLNNNAGGTWTPSLANVFAGANDAVNNAGLINVRSGDTVFLGLENFTNQSGGVINMQYGAAPTDTLTVGGFTPQAGGIINVNVEPGAANGAGDSGGQGRGDTIIVTGAANSAARTTINVASLGAAPTTLTGSIAIVNTTAADVLAPTAGATLTASGNYVLGAQNLPDAGTRLRYTLVDDGAGGVFLVWQPNLSATALGAYGGAVGAGGGGAGGSGTGGGAAGSALNGASGSSAGVGGVGLGGGPTGGGVVGRIGDMAAGSALGSGSSASGIGSGSLKDASVQAAAVAACQRRQAWGQIEGERARSDGGGTGQSQSLSGGVDVDVSEWAGLSCNRIGLGLFGFGSNARNVTLSSTSVSETSGIGGYMRFGMGNGLYGSFLGAASWSDGTLSNAVYGSTADKRTTGLMAAATVGYVARVASTTAIDVRAFASYNASKADPFTDSVGISVSSMKDNIRTHGATIGLHHGFSQSLQGFVRAGIKWAELDSSVTAFDNTLTGSVKGMSTSLEAGFVGSTASGVQLGVSGFGSFSDGSSSYGAKAHVGVKF